MNDDELRQAVSAMDTLRAQMESLSEQLQLIQASISEFSRARDTARNYTSVEENAEVMVPVGGGVYLPVKAVNTGRGLVSTAVGYTFEEPLSRIMEMMDARIKELVEASQKVYDRMGEMQRQMNGLQAMIEREAEMEQGRQAG